MKNKDIPKVIPKTNVKQSINPSFIFFFLNKFIMLKTVNIHGKIKNENKNKSPNNELINPPNLQYILSS